MNVAEEFGGYSMGIAIMEISQYTSTGLPLESERVANPTWEQVEQSIRRQDGFTRPLTRLRVGPDQEEPALDILGGNGRFVLWELGGGWQYYDPNVVDDKEIPVWTSDQGYRASEKNICFDVERVIRIARQFFQTCTFESLDSVKLTNG